MNSESTLNNLTFESIRTMIHKLKQKEYIIIYDKNVLFLIYFFKENYLLIYFQGMTSFMSQSGINQLNNFIFVLAIMQIVYSAVTMALGRAKVRYSQIIFLSS